MARKNIQGITIEIGGDTTKLQSALKGVEGKLKDTQNALRDVNKLLKLDPGNVELLSQKQRLLTDAIEGTEEKLKALKEAAEQANGQLAEGKITQSQFDALQREIIETEQELKDLTGEMKKFGSVTAQQMAAAGEKVKAVGEKITAVGTAMTKYVTGPILGVGAASVAAFNEVDAGMDLIVKKTGATGEALEDMEKRAQNIATSIPTSFETASNAVAEVNTRFGLTGVALETVSAQFVKFAELNDTDVVSSIDSVQTAMAAFGLGASQTGNMLDVLNAASQATGVSATALAEQMAANGTAMREMGWNAAQSAMFLAQMEKNGVDSGTAITGMRTALKNATKDGKTMTQAMGQLEARMSKARNKTEAMKIATELFGSKAGPELGAALYEGRLSLEDLNYSMDSFSGNVDSTFEATLDPIDEFKTALNTLKIVGMELVEAAAPMIKALADNLKKTVENIKGWWESLSPVAQQAVIKIAAIVAAVGPLLVIIGKVVSVVGTIMTIAPQIVSVINAVKAAMIGLNAAMAANPIILIIAAIAALIAAFIYFWKTSEKFRQFWINLWESIKNVVSKAAEAIKNAWSAATGWIKDKATKAWDGVKQATSKVTDAIGSTLKEKWSNIKRAYEEHGGGLKGAAYATLEAIKSRFTFVFDAINKLTGGKLDGIKEKFTKVWENIKNAVKTAIEKIKNFFKFKWELPKIKLPHFSIEGKFSLNPPSVPHLKVDWYKKAMEDGMVLTRPTIFGAKGNTLLGGGEAGPEAVVGVNSLKNMVAGAVQSAMRGAGAARDMTVVLQLDGAEVGRVWVPIIEAEEQRLGVRLAKA